MHDAIDAPMLTSEIETWVWPLSLQEFRKRHWLEHVFFEPGSAERLGSVRSWLPSWDPHDILAEYHGDVTVAFTRADGVFQTVYVRGPEAEKLLRAGMTAYTANIPALLARAEALIGQLRAPSVSCNVFMQMTGGKTSVHFDATESFVVQVSGRKRWYIGRNEIVPYPLQHWGPGGRVPEEMRSYWHEASPRSSPALTETIDAGPGSVLYVPRGAWHATEALEDSVSFHVHYGTLCWADLFATILGDELRRSPRWRKGVRGIGEDGALRGAAHDELETLLREARAVAGAITPEDLLGLDAGVAREPGADTRYRRNVRSTLAIEGGGGDVLRVRIGARDTAEVATTELDLSPPLVDACLWIMRQPFERWFTAADLSLAVRGVSPADALALVAALREVSLLRER